MDTLHATLTEVSILVAPDRLLMFYAVKPFGGERIYTPGDADFAYQARGMAAIADLPDIILDGRAFDVNSTTLEADLREALGLRYILKWSDSGHEIPMPVRLKMRGCHLVEIGHPTEERWVRVSVWESDPAVTDMGPGDARA